MNPKDFTKVTFKTMEWKKRMYYSRDKESASKDGWEDKKLKTRRIQKIAQVTQQRLLN